MEGILAQGVQVLSAAEETVITGCFDFQQNTVPLLFHSDANLGVFPEEPEIVSPFGFQWFPLQQVKPPVKGITGEGDSVFLITGFIPGKEGAAHGTELAEFVHQQIDHGLRAGIELLHAVIQRQVFAVAFRPAQIHVAQKVPDIFHHIQLFPPHPEGEHGVAAVGGVKLGHQTGRDIREGWLLLPAFLQVALQQGLGVAVTACRRGPGRVFHIGDHGGGNVLASAHLLEPGAAAADAHISVFQLLKADGIDLTAPDAALHHRILTLPGCHIQHTPLPEVLHAPGVVRIGKQRFHLLQIQFQRNPAFSVFSNSIA